MLRLTCIAVALLMAGLLISSGEAAVTTTPTAPAVIVALHGEVDQTMQRQLDRQMQEARRLGAKTVIFDIDTYGGLVPSGLEMASFLRGQDDLHTIAFVHNKAISAGAMIAVACDEMVMAPNAIVGDCAPIVFNSDEKLESMGQDERAKAQSPILTDFDASADRNGYNRQLLEAMVVADRCVYWLEDPKTHARQFAGKAEYADLTAKGWLPVKLMPNPIDGPDTLLTVYTDEAVTLGLAKAKVNTAAELARQRGLSIVADLSPGAGERFIEFFNGGFIRSILMMVLTISLWVFLGSPGHGAAEASAIVSLGLLLGVPLLTGYASWWEVLAIFVGLALLAFEVFVFPGHGASAIAGIALILGGLLLTFIGPGANGSILPSTSGAWINLRNGVLAISGSLAGSLAMLAWLQRYLPQLPLFNRLILTTTSGGAAVPESMIVPPENNWPGVGTAGTAVTDLRPGGSAQFLDFATDDHRTVAVVSESGYIDAGSSVVVRESRGNRIVVKLAPAVSKIPPV